MTATEYWARLIIGTIFIVAAEVIRQIAEHRWAFTALGVVLLILMLIWLGTNWDNTDFEGRP